jgi:hypothetical protein
MSCPRSPSPSAPPATTQIHINRTFDRRNQRAMSQAAASPEEDLPPQLPNVTPRASSEGLERRSRRGDERPVLGEGEPGERGELEEEVVGIFVAERTRECHSRLRQRRFRE